MGVNANIYLVYGWKLPYDAFWKQYDEDTDYESHLSGTLIDYESRVVFVGTILDESGDLRWDSPCFQGWSGTEKEALQALDSTIISEKVEELSPYYSLTEPSFFLVTIYS